MYTEFLQHVIPTFDVRLNDRDAVIQSMNKISLGDFQYTIKDIELASKWIGLCAFNYLNDRFENIHQRQAEKSDIQNNRFYEDSCGPVTVIASEMLKSINVLTCACTTKGFSFDDANHSTVMGYFKPKDYGLEEGRYLPFLYDGSLRQYFDTNEEGVLKPWKLSDKYRLDQNLLMTINGSEIARSIIETGSVAVDSEILADYTKAFIETSRDLGTCRLPNNVSQSEIFKIFRRKGHYRTEGAYSHLKPYACMPEDENFRESFSRFTALQNRLNN